jgi:hypothetical protein
MDKHIEAIVKQIPNLKLQLNLGERHRIMRSGMRQGSLWVTPRKKCYAVCVTGEAEVLMYNFLLTHYGKETWVDQGKKHWNIDHIGDVSKIIHQFGES